MSALLITKPFLLSLPGAKGHRMFISGSECDYQKAPSLHSMKPGGVVSEEIACFILVCQYKLNQSIHGNKILSDFQMGKEEFNSHDVHTVIIKIYY